MTRLIVFPAVVLVALESFRVRGSEGGGEGVPAKSARAPSAQPVRLPDGYRIEAVTKNLTFPVGVTVDDAGEVYVVESGYSYGEKFVTPGTWYGWPDFSGGMPVNTKRFAVPGKDPIAFLLDKHPNEPPKPAAYFGVHSASNGLDFSRNPALGHVGEAFVAQFGDMVPKTGKVLDPVGFKVVRADPKAGVITDFAVNAGEKNGPASRLGNEKLERPCDVQFNPAGDTLYVVDFGQMTVSEKGPDAKERTGVLWRITRGAQ
jgi:glucose/arabinose dehydrogenase